MSGPDKSASQPAGPPRAKWRILCIDDEPDVLVVLRTAFSTKHEVVTAESGVEALKIINACEPDFVICDILMPVLDGYATVEAIRRQSAFANIPVFFLTAERGKDAARRGFEAGCNLFLNKPFDPIRLLDNIDYFTRESGHTVRPKSHTAREMERLVEAARRAPAEAIPPAPPPPPPPPPPKPAAHDRRLASEVFAEYTGAHLKGKHDAFLADRKRREQEFWSKRYAQIQSFIDRHMND